MPIDKTAFQTGNTTKAALRQHVDGHEIKLQTGTCGAKDMPCLEAVTVTGCAGEHAGPLGHRAYPSADTSNGVRHPPSGR